MAEPVQLNWFDSHCHFDFDALDSSRDTDWQLARRHGVTGLLIPGITRAQGERLPAFCAATPDWSYCLGLHPYWCDQHRQEDLLWLDQALAQPGAVAVGECGMDRVLAKAGAARWEDQWYWLEQQVTLAERHGLPLVLHIRGAHDEVASELKRRGYPYGGLVHAFSGSLQQAENWCDLGFCLGVGGAMSHPRATRLRTTLSQMPLQHLLLETDSPDMTPAFLGRSANSPAMIPLYAQILATLQQCTPAELADQLEKNRIRVFPALVA